MREKSKERLGRKFEILLGSEHNYGYFDQELVERYVCLGDDFEDDLTISKSQGRFADITKSADLSMHQPGYPINLCIRDTPGVNDTFMIREQITIKSIRDSRICVVVLSAHQALSATDLGLIRLITQVKSRDVLIFVNRIDELANPALQVSEIRDSIQATLKQNKCSADAEILFGSGLWAEHAITGGVQTLPFASQKALENWAEHKEVAGPETENELMWFLSGVPDLLDAISERVSEGEGHDMLRSIASETGSLLTSVKAADNLEAKAQVGDAKLSVSVDHLRHMLDEIAAAADADLSDTLDCMTRDFSQRLERAHSTFLTRATDALAKHLELYGVDKPWTYDPTGLRMMLNSAYTIFGTKCQGAFTRAAVAAGESYRALYHQALNLPQELFDPRLPSAPRIPPPVSLGQTIALDLRGSWWSGWWNRRKSFRSQAERFHELIAAETVALLNDLIQDQASVIQNDMRAQLNGYTMSQTDCFNSMLGIGDPDISRLFDIDSLKERDLALTRAITMLDRYADVPRP